jgi:hypothetical protein
VPTDPYDIKTVYHLKDSSRVDIKLRLAWMLKRLSSSVDSDWPSPRGAPSAASCEVNEAIIFSIAAAQFSLGPDPHV